MPICWHFVKSLLLCRMPVKQIHLKTTFTLLALIITVRLLAQTIPAGTDTSRRRLQQTPIGTVTPTRETPAHDPVMTKQNGRFYLFTTGNGVSVYSSANMKTWRKEKQVFDQAPAWVHDALPAYRGSSMWAPDISYHNGKYYLFYAVSVFGKNTSCIGVAVNKTLDSASADFRWEDKGKVIQSVPGRDSWNAIDPNLVMDENNTPWLAFGSFWSGMKMVKLGNDLISIAQPEQWHTIAARPNTALSDTTAGNGAIEGPFIFKKNGYYYLFVSWDYCCRAEKSDYKVVVGRSRKVTGPYLDRDGKDMAGNGGTIIIEGDGKEWYGAGHNSTYTFDGKDYVIYHGYDARDRGRSKLIIRELTWAEDWPALR